MHPHSEALRDIPELWWLLRLRHTTGWRFQLTSMGGITGLGGTRRWLGGWVDVVNMLGVNDTMACRYDPAGGDVWEREGSMAWVIGGLLELPEPAWAVAPRLVRGTERPIREQLIDLGFVGLLA